LPFTLFFAAARGGVSTMRRDIAANAPGASSRSTLRDPRAAFLAMLDS
jgi:hypothetical protein